MHSLQEVLSSLEWAGMRLKKSKCHFKMPEVTHLGYVVSENDLWSATDKICAVLKGPVPANVSELKSFLGLINYYSCFLSNLSTLLAPLYCLLQKNAKWMWGPEQQEAFERTKNHLPLSLTCNTSSFGLIAIAHRFCESMNSNRNSASWWEVQHRRCQSCLLTQMWYCAKTME